MTMVAVIGKGEHAEKELHVLSCMGYDHGCYIWKGETCQKGLYFHKSPQFAVVLWLSRAFLVLLPALLRMVPCAVDIVDGLATTLLKGQACNEFLCQCCSHQIHIDI